MNVLVPGVKGESGICERCVARDMSALYCWPRPPDIGNLLAMVFGKGNLASFRLVAGSSLERMEGSLELMEGIILFFYLGQEEDRKGIRITSLRIDFYKFLCGFIYFVVVVRIVSDMSSFSAGECREEYNLHGLELDIHDLSVITYTGSASTLH